MCNFLSGLTFGPKLEGRFGRHYADPLKTNSHSELERSLELPVIKDSNWAKWEYTPKGHKLDLDNYEFRIDEARKPDWWTDEIEAETIRFARMSLEQVFVFNANRDLIEIKISVNLRGYHHELPLLASIGGYADLRGYTHELPLLASIGGSADLRGYPHELPLLASIGGSAYISGYTHDLPLLKKVNGREWADTRKVQA